MMSQSITSAEEKSVKEKLLELRESYRKKGTFGEEDYSVRFTPELFKEKMLVIGDQSCSERYPLIQRDRVYCQE